MDREQPDSPVMQQEDEDLGEQMLPNSQHNSSPSKENQENKVPRRPGRPPLRIKNRPKIISNGNELQNQNDEDFEAQRPKLKERNMSNRDEKQNSLDGFIKIIEYLKKIQCDQQSLHNKMNPYNLLTPTCFWYMISAEYFSYDFFTNKNPQETALEIIKRAQRTQISLPLRFIKPQKIQTTLEFQTEELKSLSLPIAEKLTSLSNSISAPNSTLSEYIQKSGALTSISEDNSFRSSTRAIVFNWIKKKMNSNQKWNYAIKPKLENSSKLPPKEFVCRVYQCEQEKKHEQLEVAPQIYYRPRKVQKSETQIKKAKPAKKINVREKKSRKAEQDQIYDESESEKVIKQESPKEYKMIEQQEVRKNVQMEQQQMGIKKQEEPKIQNELEAEPAINDNVELEDNALESEKEQIKGKIYETVTLLKNYNEDDVLLDAVLHMPLDNVISILKASIETPRLPYLIRPFMPAPKNDPLQLVYQTHPDEEIFLNYMRQRQQRLYQQKTNHNQQLIQEKQRECQVEDAKCQVCTDGDYTEDNLIVFCSMCNISLHQRCVGLAKVPADNWICEVCASFGPAGINVPCPLCNVKGGALKRTSIHINTPLFKDTNPEYHEFAKKCPNYKHKQQYIHPPRTGVKGEEEPYYDYFSKTSYPTDQPVCHYVWVHYVCAIWIPQCYFEQKNGLINIKGVENIDKRRFKERCLGCRQVRAGACVKCDNQNCTKYYHPECARKKRIYMEQLNLDKLKYLIFCQAHQPLKVKRKIEVKKKKQRDEIVKFCRGIEKYVETYKIANLPFKLLKIGNPGANTEPNKVEGRKDKIVPGQQKMILKIDKNTDEDFIKSVIEGLIKQNQIIVNLTCLGNQRYKVDEIIKPSKRDMRKSLTRQEQFWKNYKSSETPQSNLRRFNNIMRQNNYLKQKIENFINFGSNPEQGSGKDDKKGSKRGIGRRRKDKFQTVIEEQGAIFCVCRRPYNGENDMFQCEVCNQWYHHECIGFVGSEEDAQKLVFHCMKCLKYQSPQVRNQLLEKCSQFFSPDSLYLNYRPPTPSLKSEDEQAKPSPIQNDQVRRQQNVATTMGKNQKNDKLRGKFRVNLHEEPQYDIPAGKINFQMPFVIFDPSQKSKEITNLANDKQYQIRSQSEEGHEEINNIQENVSRNQQILSEEKSDINIKQKQRQSQKEVKYEKDSKYLVQNQQMSEQHLRMHSGTSSQLPTPEFRPQMFSFAGDGVANHNTENIADPSGWPLNLEVGNQRMQRQNQRINEEYHFNRQEIEKLKNSIDEHEKDGDKQVNEDNIGISNN